MVNENVAEDKIGDLVNSLYSQSGLDSRTEITFEGCHQMLKKFHDDVNIDLLTIPCKFVIDSTTYIGLYRPCARGICNIETACEGVM